MKIEEPLDVLQNIESMVVTEYRQHPEMTDYDVSKAFAALIQTYRNETIGKPANIPNGELSQRVYEGIKVICNWRLGRSEMHDQKDLPIPHPEPLPVETILQCLKRLTKSLDKWNKEGGQRGYLEYISQFL